MNIAATIFLPIVSSPPNLLESVKVRSARTKQTREPPVRPLKRQDKKIRNHSVAGVPESTRQYPSNLPVQGKRGGRGYPSIQGVEACLSVLLSPEEFLNSTIRWMKA